MTAVDRFRTRPAHHERDFPHESQDVDASPNGHVTLWTGQLPERVGWTAVAVALLGLGIEAWQASTAFRGAAILQMAMVAIALGAGCRCWTARTGPSRVVQLLLLGGLLAALGVTTAQQVTNAPFYGTDSVAFGQYSAQLVLRGINPFAHTMGPSIPAFRVPVIYTTHYLDGRNMLGASYPAGSFLFYLPALALGWSAQAAVVIDVLFWAIAMLLLWTLLPATVRWLAGLVLSGTVYTSFIVGGVTDSLYIPFLIIALWRWDRYGDPTERSPARWVGPFALGVAMSVKQTPWFVLPFLLVGVAIEAKRHGASWIRRAGCYAGLSIGVFAVINAPWIVQGPVAWFKGAVSPVTASFVPLGQGVINLSLIEHVGGGDLRYYTVAAATAYLVALLSTLLYYDRFKRAWMFLLIATFFFAPRSLGNYFLMLMPGALIAAVTVRATSAPERWRKSRSVPVVHVPLRAVAVGGALLVILLSLGLAAAARAPLSLKVVGLHSNGQEQRVTAADLRVHNNSGSSVRPYFTVNSGGYITNFWTPSEAATGNGATVIPPHATRELTITAPDVPSMPGISEPFQVYAYTTAPTQSVSASDVQRPTTRTLYLSPAVVDTPIPLGQPIHFTVEVDDRFGRPIHEAGIRIQLAQIVYAEHGLLGGAASINGGLEGASPLAAFTDASGRAIFVVRGVQAGADPTYFQAWIAPLRRVPPTGYSQIVAVRFVQPDIK